jgi:hypothetical protein
MLPEESETTSQLRRLRHKALSVVFQLTFFPRIPLPWILISGDTVIDESMKTLGVTRLSGVVEMFRQ